MTAEYFGRLALVYDRATGKARAWTAPGECFRLLKPYLRRNVSVLDLGTGTGQMLRLLAGRGRRIVGVDFSPEMLSIARRKVEGAKFVLADVRRVLPISRPSRFDIVTAIGVLEFVPDFSKFILDVSTHLKKGGLFCFTYEELLPRSRIQAFRKAPRGLGLYKPVPASLSFPVYRRPFREVAEILDSHGLAVLKARRFRAYSLRNKITGLRCPVIYRCVLAGRQ